MRRLAFLVALIVGGPTLLAWAVWAIMGLYAFSAAFEAVNFFVSHTITVDPPSFQWTPMLAFWSWRGVSDECGEAPGFSGVVQA